MADPAPPPCCCAQQGVDCCNWCNCIGSALDVSMVLEHPCSNVVLNGPNFQIVRHASPPWLPGQPPPPKCSLVGNPLACPGASTNPLCADNWWGGQTTVSVNVFGGFVPFPWGIDFLCCCFRNCDGTGPLRGFFGLSNGIDTTVPYGFISPPGTPLLIVGRGYPPVINGQFTDCPFVVTISDPRPVVPCGP